MLKVYLLNCSDLYDNQTLMRALPLLSQERMSKTNQLQVAEKKAQSAAAGLLMRHLFGNADINYGAHGKPHLRGASGTQFNITHSGSFVACAISDQEVGVDAESISDIKPAVLRRCFTADEQQWIADDAVRFTRLWTMKEAYMKLLGTGFSLAPKDVSLVVPPHEGYDVAHRCHWHFPHWDIPVTVCCRSDSALEIVYISTKDLL